jgi:type IV fimbrial biogenesis protein FimT
MKSRTTSGMSLIEILIGFVLVGILISMGVPMLGAMLQNMQVRSAAESILNGLQVARINAVQRNREVIFSMPGPDSSWEVTLNTPPGSPDRLIQSRSGQAGSSNARISPLNTLITFNGLGATTLPAGTMIEVTNTTGGACQPVGNIRCLNITVSVGGQIKMCDPHPDIQVGDSRRC